MARCIGSVCKLCRREGEKLFLKGARCESAKCAIVKRNYQPGQHSWSRGRPSNFGVRLREKQKLKRIYGVAERQFKLYFQEAERLKGNTGENLMMLLERRLDNVVLASGFALSRNHARQLINHGHFRVNGRKTDICSFQVRPGDSITPSQAEGTRKRVSEALEVNKSQPIPAWIQVSGDSLTSQVVGIPRREDVPHPIQEQLIIELCSK